MLVAQLPRSFELSKVSTPLPADFAEPLARMNLRELG
jgi:hypothetical protein